MTIFVGCIPSCHPRDKIEEKGGQRNEGRDAWATMFVVSSNRASLEWTLARFAFAEKTNCESGRGTVKRFSGEEGGPLEGDNWLVIGSIEGFQMRRRSFPIVGDTKFLRLLPSMRTCSRISCWKFFFFRNTDNFYSAQLFIQSEVFR